ncbi:anti-sigma-28 factor, FlgM family [Methylophilaceae bacterium 11]|uniref:flagellar biosynthesis anti-sigma factor FlgM n=1 Tax=unclassified Methylotenera TaxID=2643294 RepID=UPI000366BD98|nr:MULTISPECIES: flagellar biosynthesis anti-sigma factor FlgM [unclassified Methylotenera]EUJ10701.1 anti-sigma-28 factor, FlgM family [Methylophilaceae bacterium 11]
MKINDSIKNKLEHGVDTLSADKASAGKRSSTGGVADNKSTVAAASSENVTLSPMSVQLQAIASEVSTSGVFDTEKVNAIKSAIESGQFKVNSEKVADGLIDTVKDLLKNK